MPNISNHPLKVLVIGNGGREHALCWKLAQSPLVEQVFCAPGNGGTATEHKTKNINIDSHDFPKLAEFCQTEKIDLTVVGPENILAEGIVDYFTNKHLRIFGPTKEAAQLEWSKAYAKEFMSRHNLPTAKYKICSTYAEAEQIVQTEDWARVIKVNGLASGKGVYVCDNQSEAKQALVEIFQNKHFGKAGETVVLEEKLNGEEISLFLLCDGKTFLPMVACQDNKRRFDDDKGPNTGGMGVISPPAIYAQYQAVIEKTIIEPLQKALQQESNYKGLIYVGVLLDQNKKTDLTLPHILEFNCRFGDPETQVVLPRLQSDLLPALWACTEGNLDQIKFEWAKQACCCVVAVNKDYPASSSNGQPISLDKNGDTSNKDIIIFQAGTKMTGDQLVTAGGRILAVTAMATDLPSAARCIYNYLPNIQFKDMDYRKDIARPKTVSSSNLA